MEQNKMEEIEELKNQLCQLQDCTGSIGDVIGSHDKENRSVKSQNKASMEESDKLQVEVKRLTRELEESRSRSRRIAIHSER